MIVIVEFDENDEAGRYLLACARIRDISTKRLVNRLFETIATDQLVLSILDDDSKPAPKQKNQHGFRERPCPTSSI